MIDCTELRKSDAHVELIVQLCDAIKAFVTTEEAQPLCEPVADAPSAPNDNDERAPSTRDMWADIIGLRGILVEYGLKASQVAKLRQRWGFPSPITCGRRLLFSRSEIERWARSQPNRDNLAIVLRIRARHP